MYWFSFAFDGLTLSCLKLLSNFDANSLKLWVLNTFLQFFKYGNLVLVPHTQEGNSLVSAFTWDRDLRQGYMYMVCLLSCWLQL